MKKQLLVLGLLFVAANVEAKTSSLTPVNQTWHYKNIPSSLKVGETYTIPKPLDHLYDSWTVTVTKGKSYLKANGLTLKAVSPGQATVTLTGSTRDKKTNSATKSITVTN